MREWINLVEAPNNNDEHELEFFGHEPNFNIQNDEDGDGPATFPDGGQWFICTDWACYVRRMLGNRAKIYGFENVDDESEHGEGVTSAPGLADFDGHDFAVVDDRYIVDGWLKNIEGFRKKAVIDMHDPANAEVIKTFYGNPAHWKRGHAIEKMIDNESPETRARAMRGVTPFGKPVVEAEEPSVDPLRAKLEDYFNDPAHVPDRFNRREECYVFPDGSPSAICTNWMRYVRRILGPGRVKFFGFGSKNDGEIAKHCYGHDFAVVDGRYICDGWLKHVMVGHHSAVLDLKDPADQAAIQRLYGDPSTWEDESQPVGRSNAEEIDAETAKDRAKAMRGVKPF